MKGNWSERHPWVFLSVSTAIGTVGAAVLLNLLNPYIPWLHKFVSQNVPVLWLVICCLFFFCLFVGYLRFGRSQEPASTAIANAELVQVCREHRKHTRLLFESAFKGRNSILLVTIKSKHTFNTIDPLLPDAHRHGTSINVLTWDPNVPLAVVEAFRGHTKELGLSLQAYHDEITSAYDKWDVRSKQYSNLRVLTYASIPTLQGVVVRDEWAMVELLPYGENTETRPVLIVERKTNPELFNYFQQKFDDLWQDSRNKTRLESSHTQ